MELFFEGHTLRYAVEQMLLTLYPGERPVYPERPDGALPCARISLKEGTKYVTSVCRLETERGVFYGRAAVLRAARTDAVVEKRLHSQAVKLALYRAALASGLPKPVWGALGGVRPAKLMARLLDEGLSPRAACTRFRADYDVSPGKARLCLDAALAGRAAADSLQPRDVCLYVGIPFCPTRCAYCSFVSSAVGRSAGLTEPFLQALRLTPEDVLSAYSATESSSTWYEEIRQSTEARLSGKDQVTLLRAQYELLDLPVMFQFYYQEGEDSFGESSYLELVMGDDGQLKQLALRSLPVVTAAESYPLPERSWKEWLRLWVANVWWPSSVAQDYEITGDPLYGDYTRYATEETLTAILPCWVGNEKGCLVPGWFTECRCTVLKDGSTCGYRDSYMDALTMTRIF